MNDAERLIEQLKLQPLENEGGFFARTWASPDYLPDKRATITSIHYLLTPESFSALHRLDADEIWYFHAGDPVEHLQLSPADGNRLRTLGTDVFNGELLQLVAPRGVWQGARIAPAKNADRPRCGWSLLSCTMSPGWSPECFELGKRDALTAALPDWTELIEALTRVT